MVLQAKQVQAAMAAKPLPEFEMRHRMSLSLEYSGLNVNAIARELGVSRTTISNYLHGRTEPRRSDLIVWSMRCGVPLEWLLTGQAPTETPSPRPGNRQRRQVIRSSPWMGVDESRLLAA
jgi:transcriptional regulator with XRE-family HTH domain